MMEIYLLPLCTRLEDSDILFDITTTEAQTTGCLVSRAKKTFRSRHLKSRTKNYKDSLGKSEAFLCWTYFQHYFVQVRASGRKKKLLPRGETNNSVQNEPDPPEVVMFLATFC